ncbi:MAG: ribosomal protein S18-alanine N-acetyltransferase [Gemmatimonadota bacterium]|jgi:ribosomal-protein-alanine N-acetyltransferase
MATAEERVGAGRAAMSSGGVRVLIRRATLADVESIAAIEIRSFSNPWHPLTFSSLISQGRAHVLVAEGPDAQVVGYAVVWWVLEQGELANLAVAEGLRGKGVGSALLDRALADAKANDVESLFLEVRFSNDPAIHLYRSRGFTQVAVRRDYYRSPREDARVLLKEL